MALTQERMIALLKVASNQYETIKAIRTICADMLSYSIEISTEDQVKEQLNILTTQINNFTQPDSENIEIIKTEEAHFNSSRVKHNLYMRKAQRRHTLKKRAKIEELEAVEELNFITSKTKEIKEVPTISAILEDEEHLVRTEELNSNSADELKTKFGEDFTPLPSSIGLPRQKTGTE